MVDLRGQLRCWITHTQTHTSLVQNIVWFYIFGALCSYDPLWRGFFLLGKNKEKKARFARAPHYYIIHLVSHISLISDLYFSFCMTFSTIITLSHQYLLVIGACAAQVKHWLGAWPCVPATYTVCMDDTAKVPAPRGHMTCVRMCGWCSADNIIIAKEAPPRKRECCTRWR